ncbi:inositol 1,4,5-trisphosphate receptor-interacting protein-like 1 [Oenanthe melanoleuca]|uniref:inositol 1,4,5-trisphosphate receptor-interacting protein-like 1 n=1 Tax=Oenanthe melanoleuca TaxID=2939378 RepID=UPI0024C10558|nr:inositol 1,4,5-trisphosphate receptor-interacting protein-like 1 [Oenanthe melanoleuca]
MRGQEQEGVTVDSKEGGENRDVTVEADDSSSGYDREGSPVAANEGEDDDAIDGNSDVKVKEDTNVKSGLDLKKDEGRSEGNIPGDNTAEGNEDEPGNVLGNMEGLNEGNEGGNKDVQVEQVKDAGKEEEGGGNEEKSRSANMKASNSDDVNEGEDNVDQKEEYADVKVQESSDASEQRNSDWTGQEDSSGPGNQVDHSGFAATEEENQEVTKEDNSARNKDDVNVEGNQNEDKDDEQGNVAASEKEGSDGGKEESSSGGIEVREDTLDVGNEEGILLVDCIQWPVQDLEGGRSVTAELMESLTRVFVDSVSNSFYPVPQEAIGVGSAFEGWIPQEWDGVYRVLVPLNPPPGHAFHLERNSTGQVAARTFSVRVELVCTCKGEQLGQKLLCLLHHSQEELRQERSLLETLCTGSYLDVEKTSRWFYQLVRCSWLHVPQCYSWHLVFQPCSRSCRFQLSRGQRSLMVEMLFGVRQGDSDIFVSSQPAEASFTESTAWPETYAVAEVKFFRHVARQVPCENLHLKCLQVFTCILRGTGFSSSTWKTVVMHALTIVPLSRWSRREFVLRLWDIMGYLRFCMHWRRLDHFVLGNERLPAEISLPPAMRGFEPLNLFEHLIRDPAAHTEAIQACDQLQFCLWMLLSGH